MGAARTGEGGQMEQNRAEPRLGEKGRGGTSGGSFIQPGGPGKCGGCGELVGRGPDWAPLTGD